MCCYSRCSGVQLESIGFESWNGGRDAEAAVATLDVGTDGSMPRLKIFHRCYKGSLCGGAVQCTVSTNVGIDRGEQLGKLCLCLVALKDGGDSKKDCISIT